MAKFRKALPTIIAFCVAQGNQLTGIVNKEIGYGLWALAIILAVAWGWSAYKEWQATVEPEVRQQIQSRALRGIHLLVLVIMALSIGYLYYALIGEFSKLKEENAQLKRQISLYAASDFIPLEVAMTAPSSASMVVGTITVSASVDGNVGIGRVQFKLDGANLGAEVTAAPYSISWNTTTAGGGLHSLSAVARDAAGNAATAIPINVMVEDPPTVFGR